MCCMSNAIVNLSLFSGFFYITSLFVDISEDYVTVAANRWHCTSRCINSATRQLKSAQMDCLLGYMIIKQAFEYKTKGIYLQTQPK